MKKKLTFKISKYIILLICFFLIINKTYSENQNISKLTDRLNLSKEDTTKIILLDSIINIIINSDADKALEYIKLQHDLAAKVNIPKYIAVSFRNYALLYKNLGKYDEALNSNFEALKIFENIKSKIGMSNIYIGIGGLYNKKGDFKLAIDYLHKGLAIKEELKDERGISYAYNNLGLVFKNQGISDLALNYFIKSLYILEKYNDENGIAAACNNIGIIYDETQNQDKAIYYLDKAQKYNIKTGNKMRIAGIDINLGRVYLSLGLYDKSLQYFETAFKIFNELKHKNGLSLSQFNIGLVFLYKNNYDKAIDYLNKSLKIRLEIGDKNGIAASYSKIGEYYYKIKDYNKALKNLIQGFEISKSINSLDIARETAQLISDIYSENKNFENAYKYHVELKNINDSLKNSEKIKKIAQIEMQYDFDKAQKEKDFIRLKEDINNQSKLKRQILIKNFSIIALIIMAFMVAIVIKIYRNKQKHNIILTKQKIEILEKNQTLLQHKEEINAQRDSLEELNRELNKQNEEISEKNEILQYQNETLKQQKEEIEAQRKLLSELNEHLENKIIEEVHKNREKDLILISQSRQAVMGEMIGNIAHQWRQPLNALGIIIQNYKEAYEYNELNENYLDEKTTKAMNIINFMSQTINDFRNFFSNNKEIREFYIKDVINRALTFTEATFKTNNIKLDVDISDENICLKGYPNEYIQVIINILNNAKDVLLERNIENPIIIIKAYYENQHIVLSIADNGGGIPENVKDKIFESYFTTKSTEKGTGLGLYMSKNIIEKNMNGIITAENTINGAEFKIII